MIELIFVIVILGILAAVAIPKLSATRDDAKNAKDCTNISTCVADMGAEYTAKGTMTTTASQACVDALAEGYGVTVDATAGTTAVASTPAMCPKLATTSTFGGSNVSF